MIRFLTEYFGWLADPSLVLMQLLSGIAPAPLPAQVPLYLASADVLALPNSGREAISRRHTSPLKMFEYMAAARPIVASDLPSLRETLTDGENALLVPPEDPEVVEAAIRRTLADDALVNRAAQENWATAEARLDRRVLAPQAVDLYRQVAGESRASLASD